MSRLNEVAQPIICDAYAEPANHWLIERGRPPEKAPGRREACYYYRPPGRSTGATQADEIGTRIALDPVKGHDPLAEVKAAGAARWVAAVNADGSSGRWAYRLVKNPTDTPAAVASAAEELQVGLR